MLGALPLMAPIETTGRCVRVPGSCGRFVGKVICRCCLFQEALLACTGPNSPLPALASVWRRVLPTSGQTELLEAGPVLSPFLLVLERHRVCASC